MSVFASYRPLYRAVYKDVDVAEDGRSFLIAHYIGLSTRLCNWSRCTIKSLSPTISGCLHEKRSKKKVSIKLIAHYIGLSTNIKKIRRKVFSLSPTISGCLRTWFITRIPKVTKTYRPLYRAVYSSIRTMKTTIVFILSPTISGCLHLLLKNKFQKKHNLSPTISGCLQI